MVACPNWQSQKFSVKKMCQWTTYTKIDTLLTHFLLLLVSIYCLHTTLTHDLHIFSPIPGVNGKLTQKLTHHLHIFLFLLCQLTNYTIIDTLLTHFPLILVSIYWLHTKLTHDFCFSNLYFLIFFSVPLLISISFHN